MPLPLETSPQHILYFLFLSFSVSNNLLSLIRVAYMCRHVGLLPG